MAERERALADFEAAMQKLLSDQRPQAYRALTLQQLGRQAEAQEAYDRYRRAWPSGDLERQARLPRIAEAGSALGQLFLREGWPEPALEAFEYVLSGHPGDVGALTGRGAALGVLGRHEEALEALTKAADSSEGSDGWLGGLLRDRGRALAHLGRYTEAVAAYEELQAFEEDTRRRQEEQGPQEGGRIPK